MKTGRRVENIIRERDTLHRKRLVCGSESGHRMEILNCSLDDGAATIHVGPPLFQKVGHKYNNHDYEEERTQERD